MIHSENLFVSLHFINELGQACASGDSSSTKGNRSWDSCACCWTELPRCAECHGSLGEGLLLECVLGYLIQVWCVSLMLNVWEFYRHFPIPGTSKRQAFCTKSWINQVSIQEILDHQEQTVLALYCQQAPRSHTFEAWFLLNFHGVWIWRFV